MDLVRHITAVAEVDIPAYANSVSGGYFNASTVPTAQWANHITRELEALVELFGGATAYDDDHQIADFFEVRGALSILAHATDTGVVTTDLTRTVIGATSSQASAAGAIVCGGQGNTASGTASHVEGAGCTASGAATHAEGNGSTASAAASHAEGGVTIASGSSSHAEGNGSTASGTAAHAEGAGTIASGDYSHAEGYGTIASGDRTHCGGEYCELAEDDYIGGGKGAGAVSASGSNQNITWKIAHETGAMHRLNSALVEDTGVGDDVTANEYISHLKTKSLSTAAGSFYTLTWHNTHNSSHANGGKVHAVVQDYSATLGTDGLPIVGHVGVTPSGDIAITLYNAHHTNALAGAVTISVEYVPFM